MEEGSGRQKRMGEVEREIKKERDQGRKRGRGRREGGRQADRQAGESQKRAQSALKCAPGKMHDWSTCLFTHSPLE